MKKNASLKIAVVDDDASIRDSLSILLSIEGHTVSCFADGEQFLQAYPKSEHDVVILDLQMPNKTGMDVLNTIETPARAPIVMMSAHGDISSAVQAIRLGAFDFLEKPVAPDALLAKLAEVVDDFSQPGGDAKSATEDVETRLDVLTPQEKKIAQHLHEGMTNKEIARALDLSPRTIEVHRARVFEKLKVRNVAGLVRLLS